MGTAPAAGFDRALAARCRSTRCVTSRATATDPDAFPPAATRAKVIST